MKPKRPQIAKATLSKKTNAGGITIPNFKLYYRAISSKNKMILAQNRHIDQWSRMEKPEIKRQL
jgi:hypothetical protein